MHYRKLIPDDYRAAQRDLATLTAYHTLCAAALDLYGPNTHKIEVELDGEYNDEGGTDYRVTHISASDVDGKVLYFDPTTPRWQKILTEGYAVRYANEDDEPFDVDGYETPEERHWDMEERFGDDLYEVRYEIYVDNYDTFDFECIVGKPPELKYQDLYVLEADE